MKKKINLSGELNKDLGLLLLRILIGILMAFYGIHKLNHFTEFASSDFWQSDVSLFGLTGKIPLALTIFAELFCSCFLIFGIFTRFALLPLIFCMGFIVVTIAKFKIITDGDNGFEFNQAFIYLVIYIVLFFTGPGKYSIDNFLLKKRNSVF
jgi:putative oxidoreductase